MGECNRQCRRVPYGLRYAKQERTHMRYAARGVRRLYCNTTRLTTAESASAQARQGTGLRPSGHLTSVASRFVAPPSSMLYCMDHALTFTYLRVSIRVTSIGAVARWSRREPSGSGRSRVRAAHHAMAQLLAPCLYVRHARSSRITALAWPAYACCGFIVILGSQVLQSICTVAFDHSRTKMPLPLAVSAHSPPGTP